MFSSCFQKTLKSFTLSKNEDGPKYLKLREWLNQLSIDIPNELVEEKTSGIIKDLTFHKIDLDRIITTNPEKKGNRTGLNITLKGIEVHVKGEYTLIKEKHFTAYISRLNLTLPFYLIQNPENGLVTEVDTSGLDMDLQNAEIELDLEIGDLMRNLIMAILREILVLIKEETIENKLAGFLNDKLGELFQKLNHIIENGAEPKPLNISMNEEEINDLKKSPLISAISYLLNNLIGVNGPADINTIINILTENTGNFRLHEFYNKEINFDFNLTNRNSTPFGNIAFELNDLNIGELNTWKKFKIFEPHSNVLLNSDTSLDNLTVNISFSLKLKLDNTSNLVEKESILYQKIKLRTNLVDNEFKTLLQMPLNREELMKYTDRQCLNLECAADLADSTGTGIASLSLNESFTYLLLEVDDKEKGLEDDLDDAIDKLVKLFVSSFDGQISILINAFLNSTVINLINEEINNYLNKASCHKIEDPEFSEIEKNWTMAASASAIFLFFLLILFPYFIYKDSGKYNPSEKSKINENKEKLVEVESNHEPSFSEMCVHILKEFNRRDPEGASLFLNPKVPIFWRIFLPLAILATIALFVSSNSSTGASVFIIFNLERRVQIPSLFDFGLVKFCGLTYIFQLKN